MKILVLGIHGVAVVVLTVWVYATLSHTPASTAEPYNWISFQGLQTVFYMGIPLWTAVAISYLKALSSGSRGFWSETSLITYLLAYFSFALMLLSHIADPIIRIPLFLLHMLSIVILCYACWKTF